MHSDASPYSECSLTRQSQLRRFRMARDRNFNLQFFQRWRQRTMKQIHTLARFGIFCFVNFILMSGIRTQDRNKNLTISPINLEAPAQISESNRTVDLNNTAQMLSTRPPNSDFKSAKQSSSRLKAKTKINSKPGEICTYIPL